MPQLLNATEVTLADLQERFSLTRSSDPLFFSEVKEPLPPLSSPETQAIDRIQHNFLDQLQTRLLIEETVKLVVIAPLLDLAGFYRMPYPIESEVPIQLAIPDGSEEIIQGRIDTLGVQRSLWIVLVESKRTQISFHTGIPQALAYLLSRPSLQHPGYGLVTNGSEFIFLKQVGDRYATSNLFSLLNEGNELDRVLPLLRRFG
ncbi:MAG: restriction endonuclease subunit R [Synechococcales bacterium]|nr:restriction endonuclease subunit R [Synechococcales bacterium]